MAGLFKDASVGNAIYIVVVRVILLEEDEVKPICVDELWLLFGTHNLKMKDYFSFIGDLMITATSHKANSKPFVVPIPPLTTQGQHITGKFMCPPL